MAKITIPRKWMGAATALLLWALCGCNTQSAPQAETPAAPTAQVAATTSATAPDAVPTGYPSGEVQCEMLYWQGVLYIRDFTVDCLIADNLLHPTGAPSRFTPVGVTAAEQNDRFPDSEGTASRVPAGTPVYRDNEGSLWLASGERLILLKVYTE